jgi:hypothetical protein
MRFRSLCLPGCGRTNPSLSRNEHLNMAPVPPPPPVIDSARTLLTAVIDADVVYTDRIHLIVAGQRLGPVACLAICESYGEPRDILLLFCDADWQSKGVIAFKTVDEARARAEIGYRALPPGGGPRKPPPRRSISSFASTMALTRRRNGGGPTVLFAERIPVNARACSEAAKLASAVSASESPTV